MYGKPSTVAEKRMAKIEEYFAKGMCIAVFGGSALLVITTIMRLVIQ